MAHAITHPQYLRIRDDRSFAVITFRNAKREGAHSGLTVLGAMEELIRIQARRAAIALAPHVSLPSFEVIVVRNLPRGEHSRDRCDYDKYLVAMNSQIDGL